MEGSWDVAVSEAHLSGASLLGLAILRLIWDQIVFGFTWNSVDAKGFIPMFTLLEIAQILSMLVYRKNITKNDT